MKKIQFIIIFFFILSDLNKVYANESFEEWKMGFYNYAISQNVSEKTLSKVIKNLKFLPKVIEYDRYQPEFYEDTSTYVSKRANSKKIDIGVKTYRW